MNRPQPQPLFSARLVLSLAVAFAVNLPSLAETPESLPDAAMLAVQARAIFGPLPTSAANPANPQSAARVELGRLLYDDPRLSKNHDISCNSCHQLDNYGVDGEVTSPGHRGQRGARNSPTVYNAALHVAQFWDGREPDVEAQAQGPVLNPVEMAMPSPERVDQTLRSIPGYAPLFARAFPGEEDPVNFDNAALAIAAFERKLLTPGPFDRFMGGDLSALSERQQRGLELFIQTGCVTCHMGPTLGGTVFQKLGLVNAYETTDQGRFEWTGEENDRLVFKVPALRNVALTGPYFHDGSIESLPEAVRLMAYHQRGVRLSEPQVRDIVAFLESLTGQIPKRLIAKPSLPPSGPDTPKPDPS